MIAHEKKSPQEVANAGCWVNGHERIDHFPNNRANVWHSSEHASELCDITVNRIIALDCFFRSSAFPSKLEHFRGDLVSVVHHRVSLLKLMMWILCEDDCSRFAFSLSRLLQRHFEFKCVPAHVCLPALINISAF